MTKDKEYKKIMGKECNKIGKFGFVNVINYYGKLHLGNLWYFLSALIGGIFAQVFYNIYQCISNKLNIISTNDILEKMDFIIMASFSFFGIINFILHNIFDTMRNFREEKNNYQPNNYYMGKTDSLPGRTGEVVKDIVDNISNFKVEDNIDEN